MKALVWLMSDTSNMLGYLQVCAIQRCPFYRIKIEGLLEGWVGREEDVMNSKLNEITRRFNFADILSLYVHICALLHKKINGPSNWVES